MRKRFDLQLQLGQRPIETLKIPLNSRDELPPVLAGLQWIFTTPEVNQQVFELLEKKVQSSSPELGRPGMDLWHILVLGTVRMALNCDYDRLEYLVHYDRLMRELMGLESSFSGTFGEGFHQKTISENVCHIDECLLDQINEIVVKEGRALFKKKENEKIMVKTDSYVLESNVHFPTDLNLLWDSCRKCIELLTPLCEALELKGWRKSKAWKKKLKSLMRSCSQISRNGGRNKVIRFQAEVEGYLKSAYDLESKVYESLEELKGRAFSAAQLLKLNEIAYYHEMLIKHIDLIERRTLKNEKIPHEEKVFSLFEPHTEWIKKGKRQVELGHQILISSDQHGLILDYKVMDHSVDVQQTIPLADRLINRLGEDQIAGLSVDKGFSDKEDRELLELFIAEVTMPKKGKRNQADKEREGQKRFKLLRNKHSAIESVINSLEHHGLDRCPDKGFNGFKRYVGLGVLAYNLHKIGKHILDQKRQKQRLPKAA